MDGHVHPGLLARARQPSAAADPRGVAYTRATVAQPGAAILRGYEAARPAAERERVSFYLGVGTQNHDARSLALDGEATVFVSGAGAALVRRIADFLLPIL